MLGRAVEAGKAAVAKLTGKKPALIPQDQVPAYIEACKRVITHLAAGGVLYAVEMDFILAISEHCGNCVLWYNAVIREDTATWRSVVSA